MILIKLSYKMILLIIFLFIIFSVSCLLYFQSFQKEHFVLSAYRKKVIETSKKNKLELEENLIVTDKVLEEIDSDITEVYSSYNEQVCKGKKYYNLNKDNVYFENDKLYVKPNTTTGVPKPNINIITNSDVDCIPDNEEYNQTFSCELESLDCLDSNLRPITEYGTTIVDEEDNTICEFKRCYNKCASINNECWKNIGNGMVKPFNEYNNCIKPIDNGKCSSFSDSNLCNTKEFNYVSQSQVNGSFDTINSDIYDTKLDRTSIKDTYKCSYYTSRSNVYSSAKEITDICDEEQEDTLSCFYETNPEVYEEQVHTLDLLNCKYNQSSNCLIKDNDSLCYYVDTKDTNCLSCTKNKTYFSIVDESLINGLYKKTYKTNKTNGKFVENNGYIKCEYSTIPSYTVEPSCEKECYNLNNNTSQKYTNDINEENECLIENCYSLEESELKNKDRIDKAINLTTLANNKKELSKSLHNKASIFSKEASIIEEEAHNLNCETYFEYDHEGLNDHIWETLESNSNYCNQSFTRNEIVASRNCFYNNIEMPKGYVLNTQTKQSRKC
jgi:hypothetical protein